METLTKENFWDKMEQKYPKAIAHFKEWIDKYKKENSWNTLFSNYLDGWGYAPEHLPKYHELPIAMQFGIFIEYATDAWESTNAELYLKDGFLSGVITAIESCFDYMEAKL